LVAPGGLAGKIPAFLFKLFEDSHEHYIQLSHLLGLGHAYEHTIHLRMTALGERFTQDIEASIKPF
jgi:hypothetical protein